MAFTLKEFSQISIEITQLQGGLEGIFGELWVTALHEGFRKEVASQIVCIQYRTPQTLVDNHNIPHFCPKFFSPLSQTM